MFRYWVKWCCGRGNGRYSPDPRFAANPGRTGLLAALAAGADCGTGRGNGRAPLFPPPRPAARPARQTSHPAIRPNRNLFLARRHLYVYERNVLRAFSRIKSAIVDGNEQLTIGFWQLAIDNEWR